jgi:tetratricopeptide (TPR) repeat protein
MIGLIIKIALTLGSLAFTVYLFNEGSWVWGIFMILVTAFFGLFIFRNQNIILAALQLRQQNIPKAQKHLSRIRQPQYLFRGQRAYYYYIMALASQQDVKMSQTETMLRKALSIGLKKDHDQAMAKINIAAVCMQTGRRREAETLLSEAKKLDKKGLMTDYIKSLKKQMGRATSANQLRMAQMNKGKKIASKKMR